MKFVKGWYLPDSDTHFEHYIKDGGYQTVHRNTILNHIVMNKHILKNCVDVGSHIGFWSKDFTKLFKHTYAFDPIPQVRECYVKNITNSNYTLYPYGLGKEEKKISVLYSPKETGNTHASNKGNMDIEVKAQEANRDLAEDILRDIINVYKKAGKQLWLQKNPERALEYANIQAAIKQQAINDNFEALKSLPSLSD